MQKTVGNNKFNDWKALLKINNKNRPSVSTYESFLPQQFE